MKSLRLTVWFVVIAATSLMFWSNSYAQLKIRYINSQRVLTEYQGAKDIQKKLDEIRANYENEYNKMLQQYNQLTKEIQNQSLLLSPEKKAEKQKQAQELAQNLERYRTEKLGPQGEFYKKNLELTKPLYDKIDQVLQKIGKEEGYDYILDVVQGVVLYTKDEYDITNRVIEELNKTQVKTK